MLRKLRVLAAFFMVPVVIFVTPQTASAAVGPWHTIRLEVPAAPLIGDAAPGTIDTIDCTFSLRQTGGVIDQSTGACYGLPDVTPGYTQPGEAGSGYALTVRGLSVAGGSCDGSRSATLGAHSANGTLRVAGTMPPGTIYAGDGDCNVTTVCLDLGVRLTDPACVEVDIPSLEPEPDNPLEDGCVHGFPHVSWQWRGASDSDPAYTIWTLEITYRVNINGVSTMPWAFGYRLANTTGAASVTITNQTPQPLIVDTVKRSSNSGPPTRRVTGVEFAALDPKGVPGSTTAGGWNEPLSAKITSIGSSTIPTSEAQSYHGWTQPEECRFYYGEKVVDAPGTTADDPVGTGLTPYVPPPPPPDEPPVDPPTENPDPTIIDLSWLWSALNAVKNAIVSGFNAVAAAISAIWDGFTDAMKDLFLPPDDYLDTKWTGVSSKFEGTSPGLYMDDLQSFSPGSVSGCGGLPLTFTLPGGVAVNEHIGAACSGTMASAANVTRAALTAVFFVGGAIACVRAVGSGLGWNPGIGRSES